MTPTARRAALVLAPAVLLAAVALVVREAPWEPRSMVTRSGAARTLAPGYFVLWGIPLFCLFYAATFSEFMSVVWPHRPGMREPTEAELGCAVLLTRGFIVLAIYALAYVAWAV